MPPSGDWLARRVGNGLNLAEAGQFALDGLVCRSVIADLQRDAPPRFEEAQAAANAQIARWEAQAEGAAAARQGGRSRSASRGPPEGCQGPGLVARRQRPVNPRTPPLAPLPAVRSTGSPASGSRAHPPEAPGHAPTGISAHGKNSDDSLVTSLAGRLAQVEQLNKRLSAKVAEQSQEIAELHAKLESVRPLSGDAQNVEGSPPSSGEDVLQAENEKLRAQLADMRDFLAEYGLQWVPNSKKEVGGSNSGAAVPKAAGDGDSVAARLGRPCARGGGDVSVDIKVIESRVEALNALVEEEGAKSSLPLPLTFFCDGIKLGSRAFLAFELPSAQELLKDVLDGYFPKALREQHPDGALLRVVDRTGNKYAAWLRDLSHDDPELADGGERFRPAVGHAVNAPRDRRSAGERLLDRLPERVVRGGRVCEIRGPLAAQLAPGRAVAGAAAPAAQERQSSAPPGAGSAVREEVSLLPAGRDPAEPVARVQVRMEGGQRVLLALEPSATIGALWAALERWRAGHRLPRIGSDGRRYSLRSAYPPRTFSDHEQTLEAVGLTPSATLFLSADATEC